MTYSREFGTQLLLLLPMVFPRTSLEPNSKFASLSFLNLWRVYAFQCKFLKFSFISKSMKFCKNQALEFKLYWDLCYSNQVRIRMEHQALLVKTARKLVNKIHIKIIILKHCSLWGEQLMLHWNMVEMFIMVEHLWKELIERF